MLFSLNNTPKLIIKISNTIIKKTNYAFFIKNNKDEYFFSFIFKESKDLI